jgi:hypothetical protein
MVEYIYCVVVFDVVRVDMENYTFDGEVLWWSIYIV